jgi:hypothetical protein
VPPELAGVAVETHTNVVERNRDTPGERMVALSRDRASVKAFAPAPAGRVTVAQR